MWFTFGWGSGQRQIRKRKGAALGPRRRVILVLRLLIERTGRSIGTKRLFNNRQPLCGAVKKIVFSIQLGVCRLDEDCDQTSSGWKELDCPIFCTSEELV
jgi:hypothetical protein